MPDADGFPTADEIINGFKPKPQPKPKAPSAQVHMPKMDEKQEKAIRLILSGLPFALVTIRPTKRVDGSFVPCEQEEATGNDFLTVLRGDKDQLMGAKSALPEVIDRMYTKEGLL